MATKDNESDSRYAYSRLIRTVGVGVVALGMSISAGPANAQDKHKGDAQIWSERIPIRRHPAPCTNGANNPPTCDVISPRNGQAMKSKLPELTGSEFEERVLNADKPVVIEVWAGWSVASRGYMPVVDRVSDSYSGKINFAKMQYDNIPSTPSLHNYFGGLMTGVPTTFFVYEGRILDTKTGPMDESALQLWLDRNMNWLDYKQHAEK